MGEDNFIPVSFPVAGGKAIFTAAGLFILFITGTFGLELYRRRRERKLKVAAEWRGVTQVLRERELTKDEKTYVERLVQRHLPKAPYSAVTVRNEFDHCVNAELPFNANDRESDAYAARGVILRDIRMQLGLDRVPQGHRIYSTRDLELNHEIFVSTRADAPVSEWSRMVVASIDEGRLLLVPAPQEHMPKLTTGQELRCRLWREEDARYAFSLKILKQEMNPPGWITLHADDLKRMQARAHFRIPYEQASDVGVINAMKEDDFQDVHERVLVTRFRGRFTSLSAGGFALISHQPVPNQVLLRVALGLGSKTEEPLLTHARIVGTHSLSGGRYLVRASYVALKEEERERVVHYVTKRQKYPHGGMEQYEKPKGNG